MAAEVAGVARYDHGTSVLEVGYVEWAEDHFFAIIGCGHIASS